VVASAHMPSLAGMPDTGRGGIRNQLQMHPQRRRFQKDAVGEYMGPAISSRPAAKHMLHVQPDSARQGHLGGPIGGIGRHGKCIVAAPCPAVAHLLHIGAGSRGCCCCCCCECGRECIHTTDRCSDVLPHICRTTRSLTRRRKLQTCTTGYLLATSASWRWRGQ
jgi:hypothetical protein